MPSDWLVRSERRLRFLALPGLPGLIAGMNAAVGVLALFRPDFPDRLALDPAALASGEVWRVFTFLFIPNAGSPVWLAVWVVLIYVLMRRLELAWGELRLTLFLLCGAACMTAAALLSGAELSSWAVHLSVFFAFARLHPDMPLLVMFLFPVKVRWLAAAAWVWVGWVLVLGGAAARLELLAGLASYAAFFGDEHWAEARRFFSRAR